MTEKLGYITSNHISDVEKRYTVLKSIVGLPESNNEAMMLVLRSKRESEKQSVYFKSLSLANNK